MGDEIVVRVPSPTEIDTRLNEIDTRLPTDVERSDAVSGVEPVGTGDWKD
jgi:hypothetical protein